MPRRSNQPILISNDRARHIWLRASRLDTATPFGAGPQAVADAVSHLGYVQIDTINVIERCHHHILFTRIPDYRRSDLRHAQSIDKTVFEYWTHALAYVPTRDLPYFVAEMRAHRRAPRGWFESVTPSDLRKVMRLVKTGPLTIRDIDDDVLIDKQHLWASRKPSKHALQLAFYNGVMTVSSRTGMVKTYDLMTRHFGWETLPKPVSARRTADYLLDRALRAQGIVSLDSICHLDAPSKALVRRQIDARVRDGSLVPVAIDGADKQQHWASQDVLDTTGETYHGVHILSPFDPLIIQRKRTRLFFGYDHRFEAYVPKEKRVLGYFALPVLVDGVIVAALDLKTARLAGELLIKKWTWVGDRRVPARQALKRRIEDELDRFTAFQLGN